jgi:hypothetical protein
MTHADDYFKSFKLEQGKRENLSLLLNVHYGSHFIGGEMNFILEKPVKTKSSPYLGL